MKRLLVMIMVLTILVTSANVISFADSKIDYNFSYAFIYGYDTGIFAPKNNVTREEVAAVLYRILKQSDNLEPFTKPSSSSYADVGDDRWSLNALEYMKTIGALPNATKIQPAQSVSRSEAAKIMAIAMGLSATSETSPFSDVSVQDPNFVYIMALSDAGVINGYGDGTFKPDDNIVRAEFTKMVNKMIGRGSNYDVSSITESPFPDVDETYWAYLEILRGSSAFTYNEETARFEVDPNKKIDRATLDTDSEPIVTPPSNIAVESVSLDKSSIVIAPLSVGGVNGVPKTLVATVLPADATNKAVTWESSNDKVATVDANGVVNFVKPGKAIITVKTVDGNKTATCTVKAQW